ncbi:MAG: hypothetical protein ACXVB1_08935 [Pseudobdellovibrionaceae bacterium]
MIEKLKAQNMTLIFCVLFFIKSLALGNYLADCLGLFVVILSIQADKIVRYLFPKRVDLHTEFSLMEAKLIEMKTKLDEHERDLTALKFSNSVRTR